VQQLNAQGVQAGRVNGRVIRIKQPTNGPLVGSPIGVGVGTSDKGITTDSQVAPANMLQAPQVAVPTLSEWGVILLVALMLLTGFWMLWRRSRMAGSAE